MEKEFEHQLALLWAKELSPHGACCICGNSGVIDTRNVMFTCGGVHCGAEVFCICPNGRAMKRIAEERKEELRAFAVAEKLND